MLSCGRERFDPASGHSRTASCWFKLACSPLDLWLVNMECSLYTSTQEIWRISAKHWFESSYQEKAGVGEEKRHRVPRFCSGRLTLFPLAQLKIRTHRTAQQVWGYGELRAFWEHRGQQRQAEKATLIGNPQQAKLVSHTKFKSPVTAHMLQAWKCIYLHKHFALWVLSVSGFRQVVAKLAVTKWRY